MFFRTSLVALAAWLSTACFCQAIPNTIYLSSLDSAGHLRWQNTTTAAFTEPVSNAVYQVQATTNLLQPWTPLPGFTSVHASNLTVSVQVPTNNSTTCFYRVALLTRILADSTADFSGVQGSNNWYYGYYDGTSTTPFTTGDFKPMTNFLAAGAGAFGDAWFASPGNVWTSLWAIGGHPNGVTTSGGREQVNQWSVRRWVSPVSGTIHIYGALVDLNAGAGNGVIGHCMIDGVEVSSYVINDGGHADFVFDATVRIGSLVDLAIDPRENWDVADSSAFYVTISQ